MSPDELLVETRGHKTACVLEREAGPLLAAFFDSTGITPLEETGRSAVYRIPLASGDGVLRYYRRGGLVAKVFADRYLGNRMIREFNISVAYHLAGGPIAEPLGVCWERTGLVYRGALVTRYLPGETLLSHLSTADPDSASDVLRKAGEAIRHMHDFGIWHADLQLKNILVSNGAIVLIDFDQARRRHALGVFQRGRNLLRLRRSFEKGGRSLDNFATLLEGYGPIRIPAWLDGAYRLRGASARYRGGT